MSLLGDYIDGGFGIASRFRNVVESTICYPYRSLATIVDSLHLAWSEHHNTTSSSGN